MSTDPSSKGISGLRAKIEKDEKESRCKSRRLTWYVSGWRLFVLALSLMAVLLGLVEYLPGSRWKSVPAPVFGVLAAFTAAVAALLQKFSWREQADTWSTRAERCNRMLLWIDHELPQPLTQEQVAQVSRSYGWVREDCMQRLQEINRQADLRWAPGGAGSSSIPGVPPRPKAADDDHNCKQGAE